MKKVLILEEEENIRAFAAANLQRGGYETLEASTGQQALDQLREQPDTAVAVLDLTLLDMDGFELCRLIRQEHSQIGILMLVSRAKEMDKITGLMTGADDYLTKPFSPAELNARVDALLRRVRGNSVSAEELLSSGPFIMNTRKRYLEKYGQRIRLTLAEYSIVRLFLQNPGRALSREEILSGVWGRAYDGDPKIVDVNIRRLRIKLEDNPNEPRFITTVWGYGYRWGN